MPFPVELVSEARFESEDYAAKLHRTSVIRVLQVLGRHATGDCSGVVGVVGANS
jgi:hypothetical protein